MGNRFFTFCSIPFRSNAHATQCIVDNTDDGNNEERRTGTKREKVKVMAGMISGMMVQFLAVMLGMCV